MSNVVSNGISQEEVRDEVVGKLKLLYRVTFDFYTEKNHVAAAKD